MMDEEQTTTEAPPAKPRPVVYIGPNASTFGLAKFQVFKGGVPAAHASNPVVARLFVEVDRLTAARAALSVEGSPEWSAYRDAAMVVFKKRGAQ